MQLSRTSHYTQNPCGGNRRRLPKKFLPRGAHSGVWSVQLVKSNHSQHDEKFSLTTNTQKHRHPALSADALGINSLGVPCPASSRPLIRPGPAGRIRTFVIF